MKNFFRSLLKRVLGYLAKLSIARHDSEVILVTGWTGTAIVREMIYHLLEKDFHVRRNTTDIWWDFSVPLTILGYEDEKRSIGGWIILLFRSLWSVLIHKKYPHKIIINLDSSNVDTAKYWAQYVVPHIVVVLKEKPKSKVVKMLLAEKGSEKILFIYDPVTYRGLQDKKVREFIYSKENGTLQYDRKGNVQHLYYKKDKTEITIPKAYLFMGDLIPAAISVGILEGISIQDLAAKFAYFELHPSQLHKASTHLKEFINSEK